MAPARNHPAPGDVISGEKFRFQILERLQAGGMNNTLFKVRQLDALSGSIFLAKFFRTTICPPEDGLGGIDQRLLKRFKKEALFLGRFNHSNIVKIIDHARDLASDYICGDQAFYVMEYVEGTTLERIVGRVPVRPRRVIYIAQEIARGLTEVHSKHIVHRDLHPGNVLVNVESAFNVGTVKLLDFGSAVGEPITRSYVYEPHYDPIGGAFHRAPEADNPQRALPSSDVFSFAVTLLELASGTLIRNECSGVWQRGDWIERRMISLQSGYPGAFVSLLRRMVNSEPRQRPTAPEILASLASVKIPMTPPEKLEAGVELVKALGLLAGLGLVVAGALAHVLRNVPPAAGTQEQPSEAPRD
jgi:serine/threonine protein kinase